ncbi:MAG: dihydrofolate reductase [Beijerinckiaceae bacterium]
MSIDLAKPHPAAALGRQTGQARTLLPISVVAAIAANGVLGHEGRIPWHLPSDMKHFRALTLGKPLLMGRKTYQSIGRPLPGRVTIVLSRNMNLDVPPGVCVACEIESALDLAKTAALKLQADEIILAGGAELFASLIDRVARLHLTRVELSPAGDTFFPSIDWSCWEEVRRESPLPQKGDDAGFTFLDFERRPGASDKSFPRR